MMLKLVISIIFFMPMTGPQLLVLIQVLLLLALQLLGLRASMLIPRLV